MQGTYNSPLFPQKNGLSPAKANQTPNLFSTKCDAAKSLFSTNNDGSRQTKSSHNTPINSTLRDNASNPFSEN